MSFFNKIKNETSSIILGAKIKKAIQPCLDGIDTGSNVYVKTLDCYLNIIKDISKQAAPIIEEHANDIASAIITLKPMFEKFKTIDITNIVTLHLETYVESISSLEEQFNKIKEQMDI
jgi:mevalonate pyrophosphate decarboxylase